MSQNTSHAVMAQRTEAHDSPDHFPTQPFATRALFEHVMKPLGLYQKDHVVWEPACGCGAMARVLAEYFETVHATDIIDYGAGYDIFDFLSIEPGQTGTAPFDPVDWIITNPPFGPASNPRVIRFALTALEHARCGVAMFGRIQMLETIKRFNKIWKPWERHALFAQHVERVPLAKGRLMEKGSTATAYGWLVICKDRELPEVLPGCDVTAVPMVFIPPSRKELVRPGDYEEESAA